MKQEESKEKGDEGDNKVKDSGRGERKKSGRRGRLNFISLSPKCTTSVFHLHFSSREAFCLRGSKVTSDFKPAAGISSLSLSIYVYSVYQ